MAVLTRALGMLDRRRGKAQGSAWHLRPDADAIVDR